MKFFTKKQKNWLLSRNIKVGKPYTFPKFGFSIYETPNYSSGERIDTNPFTKSLEHEMFLVKGETDGFLRGNFYYKPHHTDFYLTRFSLEERSGIEILFLIITCFIPLVLYNYLWTGKKKAFKI